MASENIAERLRRLIGEAVRGGAYASERAFFEELKMSTGTIAELQKRLRDNPDAGMTGRKLALIAQKLGMSVDALQTGETPDSALVDKYRERAKAIDSARGLKYPEAAIQAVLRENPPGAPTELYWFLRIQAEAERISPAADSGSQKI